MAQVSRRLIVGRPVQLPEQEYDDLLFDIDVVLAKEYCKNKEFDKGFELYERLVRKAFGDYELRQTYEKFLVAYVLYLMKEKKYQKALEYLKKVLKLRTEDPYAYKYIGMCLTELGQPNKAFRFFQKYEELATDKEEVYRYLADIYYENFNNGDKAIEYYEKLLVKYPDDAHINNMLGHLYSTYRQDKDPDKQIAYLKRAWEIAPNNKVITKNLAYVLGKFKMWEEADLYYAKLQRLNPSHSDLHSYGGYLVSKGDFEAGFRFLTHRFLKEDLDEHAFSKIFYDKKVRWNEKVDLKGKSVILHFEQGFGDSIMFVRYIHQLKKMCDKIAIVLQRPLISLFEGSDLGVEIFPDTIPEGYKYDVVIPMMDTPLVCKTTPDTIPLAEGYLKVSQEHIDEFRDKYIRKNDKFKIGIAFEGSVMGKETDRDIPLKFMYPLMELPGVDIYCFQVSDPANQMDNVPSHLRFTRLGDKVKSFRDTACGLKCMDLFISSDNGVMNLAGALGIPSICLFNAIQEWRWIDTVGDDVVWYKSVKPIQCPTSKKWDYTISEAIKIVEKMQLEKLNKKLKMTAQPKGSIKSRNISPNAMVSLNQIEGLLNQEIEEAKKAEEVEKSEKKPATKKATKTTTAKKTTTKKTTTKKITSKTAEKKTTTKKAPAKKITSKTAEKKTTTKKAPAKKKNTEE